MWKETETQISEFWWFSPVSEINLAPVNPFETKRNS